MDVQVDLLLVPTALHHYLIKEVEATEKEADVPTYPYNANLGRFTNFVNLMDLCALSVPSGVARLPKLDASADGTPDLL
jgi:allophanate hydrolase